ncbi:MAG: TIGR03790 family protein [Kiritimatiellae bacterium]|nr:TIGR03790 family protein [Kiritimatiellia bacterium]
MTLSSPFRSRILATLACALYLVLLPLSGWAIPERVVVVANQNVPESLELARYYMEARKIPEDHLVALDLPTGETMTRWHYKHQLLDPLLASLRDRGLIQQVRRTEQSVGKYQSGWRTIESSIDYLVSIYGVPVKIADTKPFSLSRLATLTRNPSLNNGAAVDSELALALYDDYELDGPFANPLHQEFVSLTVLHPSRKILMATRLDGPDPQQIKTMIDRTLDAETYGLHGYGCFDLQNIRESGYFLGDYWLWEASERLAREGFSVMRDMQPETLSPLLPLEKIAFYMGWYSEQVTGPFAREDFQFQPGAIAYHLHSGSGKSIRTATNYWVGPLLARGASVVMGAVDEPYLKYTPDLKVFTEHLCSGMNYGQSAYASMRTLSWQITLVGDPLYRPFQFPPEVYQARLRQDHPEDEAWIALRLANRLIRSDRFNPALSLLRQKIRDTKSQVLQLRLADLYAVNHLESSALDVYQEVIRTAETPETAVRAGLAAVELLRAQNRPEDAEILIHDIRMRWPDQETVQSLTLPRR